MAYGWLKMTTRGLNTHHFTMVLNMHLFGPRGDFLARQRTTKGNKEITNTALMTQGNRICLYTGFNISAWILTSMELGPVNFQSAALNKKTILILTLSFTPS